MCFRHQAYTLYYRHVGIPVFLDVFAYSMLLRCMHKFKRVVCGSEDVTQYNTMCSFHRYYKLGLLLYARYQTEE